MNLGLTMKIRVYATLISSLLLFAFPAHSFDPLLRYSDIVTGPDIGLGDGFGSGAIVTVWGQNLGTNQGTKDIIFKDSSGVEREVAHVYYWKNADGEAPGGPSDLFASHKMQEIAFSIPNSAVGAGEIIIRNGTVDSNALPFTVSTIGTIYWVAPSGDNRNLCTFANPCEYINGDIASSRGGLGNARLTPGDIVYSAGVTEPDLCGGGRCSALFIRSAAGTPENNISFIAYPGSPSRIVSRDVGLMPYLSSYINLSKYSIIVGHVDPSLPPNPGNSASSDAQIYASNGRYIGNYLGQTVGTCITGFAGGITSGSSGGENVKFFGNELEGLGCPNTSRFQHTTYMSVRNEASVLQEAWDFSFNYFHDNFPMFGIHFYDEQINSGDCGQLNGTLRVTNNVIFNQWGPGINIGSRDSAGTKNPCWAADILIENNLLVTTGLGDTLDDNVVPPPQAIRISGDLTPGTVKILNNTIYQWGEQKTIDANGSPTGLTIAFNLSPSMPEVTIHNNLFISNIDESNEDTFASVASNVTNLTASHNAFYTTDTTPTTAVPPSNWTNNLVLTSASNNVAASQIAVDNNSLTIDAGFQPSDPTDLQSHDLYGVIRSVYDIGVSEYGVKPNPPTEIGIAASN
jgi:hypothetical protein